MLDSRERPTPQWTATRLAVIASRTFIAFVRHQLLLPELGLSLGYGNWSGHPGLHTFIIDQYIVIIVGPALVGFPGLAPF